MAPPLAERVLLEDQHRGSRIGLRFDHVADRSEQRGRGVLAQRGVVPFAQGVDELVRVGETAARLGLRRVDDHDLLLEQEGAEDARPQARHLDELEPEHRRDPVQGRRQDSVRSALAERPVDQPGDPPAHER